MNRRVFFGVRDRVVAKVREKNAHQIFVSFPEKSGGRELEVNFEPFGIHLPGGSEDGGLDKFMEVDLLEDHFLSSALKAGKAHEMSDQFGHLFGDGQGFLNAVLVVRCVVLPGKSLFKSRLDSRERGAQFVRSVGREVPFPGPDSLDSFETAVILGDQAPEFFREVIRDDDGVSKSIGFAFFQTPGEFPDRNKALAHDPKN